MALPSELRALTYVEEPDDLLLVSWSLAHTYTDSHPGRSVCQESYRKADFISPSQ
jgi:hypothetical protein